MLEADVRPESLSEDAVQGPHPRFSPVALDRAKALLGINDVEKIGSELGFSRVGWWRNRAGLLDPRLSHARRVASRLGMTVDEVFVGGSSDA